ncbi:hypothetical protein GCM10025762_48430 [Haloechinothrix salitolerans]
MGCLWEHGQWPIYQYVEGNLGAAGLNALAILGSFPIVGRAGTQPRYQAVWFASQGGAAPRPDSHVALTIAGLRHVPVVMKAEVAALDHLLADDDALLPLRTAA